MDRDDNSGRGILIKNIAPRVTFSSVLPLMRPGEARRAEDPARFLSVDRNWKKHQVSIGLFIFIVFIFLSFFIIFIIFIISILFIVLISLFSFSNSSTNYPLSILLDLNSFAFAWIFEPILWQK